MEDKDFTTTLKTSETPAAAFQAINNVRGWWSEEIEGGTEKVNDIFDYHFEDVHRCRIKIIKSVSGKKVEWLVFDNNFKFTKDKSEWIGTRIVFDLEEKDGKTVIRFTHKGLVPAYECYDICRDAWTNYIRNSLKALIETGKGQPNAAGKPQTEDEKKFTSN